MANHFTTKVHCKKYVKAFLELNCGTPADLSFLPEIKSEFTRCLSKKPSHREKSEIANWPDTISIIIPHDDFYRYGWEINREKEMDFNRMVEQRVKFFMRQYVGHNHSLGIPVAVCIREFQDRFGFAEPIWPFESIKKDFDRNGKVPELKTVKELRNEINKILLDNLSDLGTISRKLKKEQVYE